MINKDAAGAPRLLEIVSMMKNEIHVAVSGNDSNSGSVASPVKTLGRALELARARRKAGEGMAITLHEGIYEFAKGIELAAADSGTADAPLVIRAAEGETVSLSGGRRIAQLNKVQDPAVLARLQPEARAHVRQVDLAAAGITDFGRLASRGFARKIVPSALEVFCDGEALTLARWPNAGEDARIAGVVEQKKSEWSEEVGTLEGGFLYAGDRPNHWQDTDDLWVHGYWGYDWANSHEKVVELDRARRSIKTAPPHGNYHFKTGQRFFFENVLEELDAPGEYYVDRKTGILYLWPPAGVQETIVSVLEQPLIEFKDCRHVELRGLTLECGRASGVVITGGEGVRIVGCCIRNMGNGAVTINGGTGHAVRACEMSGNGDGGVSVTGGDAKTLTPARHEIVNNHIHHYARVSRCYTCAVNASGVGIRIAHNTIHDAPHTAIIFFGNDMVVEYNEIYSVCQEVGDAGAIYTGRSFARRGNKIRHNYIYGLLGVGLGTSGIYLDDGTSGQEVRGNIVWGGDGIWLGGGRDNVIENNLFIDCTAAIQFDGRLSSDSPIWSGMRENMKRELAEMNYLQEPYISHYPELVNMRRYMGADVPVPCGNNRTANNLCLGGNWLRGTMNAEAEAELDKADKPGMAIGMSGGDASMLGLADNLVLTSRGADDGEANARVAEVLSLDAGGWRVATGAGVPHGFKPLPIEKIGLQLDGERRQWLPRIASRLTFKHVAADGTHTFELSLWNGTATPLECRGRLEARSPGMLEVLAQETVAVQVLPGARVCRDIRITLPLGQNQIDWVPETPGLRPARAYVNRPIRVPELSGGSVAGPFPLVDDAGQHGEICLGYANGRLMIRGKASGLPGSADKPWRGPSVEICISPDGVTPAQQWFLTLASGADAAFSAVKNDVCSAAPGAEWKVGKTSDGVKFNVALPMQAREFRLEVFLRTREQEGGELTLSSMCRSGWNPRKFIQVVLPGE